jgi:hypothetical protein
LPNQQIEDDTTRATAHLPGLEIEIIHHRSPDADAASPEWSPAFADQATFDVKGKHLTIRQVCELVKDITEELPYLVAGKVMKAMHGDHRLIQLFAPSRTYATGSQCVLQLLEDRIARQRDN